jgi:hypothetical protein
LTAAAGIDYSDSDAVGEKSGHLGCVGICRQHRASL